MKKRTVRITLHAMTTISLLLAGRNPDLAAAEREPAQAPEPTPELAFATIGSEDYRPLYLRRINPSAIAANGRVYCAIQNSRGRPVVMAYDIAKRAWSPPVTASALGLGRDMHGSPSLSIDGRGHLHLFYGCHNRAMRHARSVRPWDIGEWKEMSTPAPRASYPQTMRLGDGTLYLFYRAGGHPEPWTVRTSRDDGLTWSAPQPILEMRLNPTNPKAASYARFFPGRDGKTIHCFFNYKEDDPSRWPEKRRGLHKAVYRFNIYYIRRDANRVWRNAAGAKVSLPISKADADAKCMVYDSGDIFAYAGAYATDDGGNPYLAFRTGVRDWDKGGPDAVVGPDVHDLNTDGKTIVPIEEHFTTYRDGRWQLTKETSGGWPADVAAILRGSGEAAYRRDGNKNIGVGYEKPYFLFSRATRDRTAIFLYNAHDGYAVRAGGPAELP